MEDRWSLVGLAFGDKINGEANMTNSISVLWYSGDRRYKKPQTVCISPRSPSVAKCQLNPFSWGTEAKLKMVVLGFFSANYSEWWTEIHDSEVTKWQEPFPPSGSACVFSQEDENCNHKASKPAHKDYCGPASVQSAKNLQASILPAYNM